MKRIFCQIACCCFCLVGISQADVEGIRLDNKVLIKSIYFGGGSYYIDEEQAEDVYKWLEGIENVHQYQIRIESHTDNIGSAKYNKYLSQMRSESTLYLLEHFHTELVNISIGDFGEHSPHFDNNDWEGKLRNRRVDIILRKLEF